MNRVLGVYIQKNIHRESMCLHLQNRECIERKCAHTIHTDHMQKNLHGELSKSAHK